MQLQLPRRSCKPSLAFISVVIALLCSPVAATLTVPVQHPAVIGASGDNQAPSCESFTANYITHGLPQQCLRTSRVVLQDISAPTLSSENPTDSDPSSKRVVRSNSVGISTPALEELDFPTPAISTTVAAAPPPRISSPPKIPSASSGKATASIISATASNDSPKESETDESPLDTDKFLSFEEWKAQNLARSGRSSEKFAHRAREPRRAPGSISTAIDSLGEDLEIELDFGDDMGSDGTAQYRADRTNRDSTDKGSSEMAAKGHAKSKDAGKTCKERFNYASFDCAATVHKTNPESKGATSILVENKDSYMLNKCAAEQKFVIVELCEDILVDTVVLASYEFFSSIFRSFRVSVSDRYPIKPNGWKQLGVFEAKNTRGVQAFLIENPLLWARYMKVEFLTHYGNEYFCPVSLLRVHGTTMMEEFKYQGEISRGEIEDEVREEVVPEAVAINIEEKAKPADSIVIVKPVEESGSDVPVQPTTSIPDVHHQPKDSGMEEKRPLREFDNSGTLPNGTPIHMGITLQEIIIFKRPQLAVCPVAYAPAPTNAPLPSTSSEPSTLISAGTVSSTTLRDATSAEPSSSHETIQSSVQLPSSQVTTQRHDAPSASTRTADASSQEVRQSLPSPPQPPPAYPTTQESFFKTVHKRLNLLETNATLSLQYIEEQSRMLRDVIAKVEKRQAAKTIQLMEQINATVISELRIYRQQYDQLWQSTVIALESQKAQSEKEMLAVSARLTLLADEIIFQKRMYQVQTILLLITICVVIFSRNSRFEIPLLQHMRSRSVTRMFDTPPSSPPFPNPYSRPPTIRRMSSDSVHSITSPTVDYSPPTPPGEYGSRPSSPVPEVGRSMPSTRNSTRSNTAQGSWKNFGPKLRLEGRGRRWHRLPSPLSTGDDFEGANEGEGDSICTSGGSEEEDRGRVVIGGFNKAAKLDTK
ncbi:hypothetical protein RUND412_005380 [Rhizina undulata]